MIAPRVRLLRRFAEFTGLYPWQCGPGEMEAFTVELVSGPQPLAHSTMRDYQLASRLFCEFVTDTCPLRPVPRSASNVSAKQNFHCAILKC